MMKPLIQNTACHLVMGFLGSGKTSFINACIANFKRDKKWAILVNEAGQIGIDEKLFATTDNQHELAIRQVSGGCICCISQLPLQIALARLTSEHKPDRLWIEPTGLAHPKELIEQLSAPHWQTALSLKSAISILNARQWQDVRYRDNEGYQAHVRFCDVIVVNRFEALEDTKKTELQHWLTTLNPLVIVIWQQGTAFDEAVTQMLTNLLNQPSQVLANRQNYRQVSLASFNRPTRNIPQLSSENRLEESSPDLPYRYHDVQNGYQIMGWRLPSQWSVEMVALMNWLLKLPQWQRIKAVIQTIQNDASDWQTLNFTPDSLDIAGTDEQVDNRIEIIFLNNQANANSNNSTLNNSLTEDRPTLHLNFAQLDNELMALFQRS